MDTRIEMPRGQDIEIHRNWQKRQKDNTIELNE